MRLALLSSTALAALMASFVAGSSPAMAGPQSQTLSAAVTSHPGNFSNYALDIPLFDPGLGTLNSVIVTEQLEANYSVHPGTLSFATVSSSPSVTAITNLTFSGGPSQLAGQPVLSVGASQSWNLPEPAADGSLPFTGYGTTSTNPPATASSEWEVGTGDPTLLLTSSFGSVVLGGNTNGSGLSFDPGAGPDLTFSISIQYDYSSADPGTSTPEPASMLVMGAGLLGLGIARKRRRPIAARLAPSGDASATE